MTGESLNNRDWQGIVEKLGGAEYLAKSARETKAFQRPRTIKSALDLLRIILAYCLSHTGLRSTSAWASAVGLAQLSNVALLQRLRRSGDWLALLVGQALARHAPSVGHGRFIRIIDGTSVPKAGANAKRRANSGASTAPSICPTNASATFCSPTSRRARSSTSSRS
jgi:hypothetical protein